MYISIHIYTEKVSNPYYTPGYARIEPQYIEETKRDVREFQDIEQFKLHVKDTCNRLNTNSKWRYFKALELHPTVSVEVNIDI